jgi:hypothetical protein
MSRKLLLVFLLSASLTAFAQTGAAPDQNNANQNQQPNGPPQAVVPAATGGTAWTGIGPTGGVLLSTPLATFSSPQPTAGISVAGRAGISDSTPVNTGLESTLTPSTLVYVYSSGTNAGVTAPAAENPATEAVSSARMMDFVPSSSVSSVSAPAGNTPSLAEVAAMYKSRQGTQTLRTYTNADVPRQNTGLLTNVTMASNEPPQPPQSSAAQPSTPAPSAQQQQSTSPQQQAPAQGAAADNSQSTQNQSPDQSKQLPASSTLLPLLGLLGVASAGAGAWYRRRNR